MNQVTVRELLRNYKKISKKMEPLVITNNGKPEKVLIPFEQWEDKDQAQCITAELLLAHMVEGGPTNLSEIIDEVAYGE